jgi:arylsulfatase A-like enzyme
VPGPVPTTALLLAALAAAACRPESSRRPDVVLAVIDTLRADRLSCYGYPRPTSPFIDSLAEEGALFEDATCQFSWTLPSMVSLLQGRYLTDYRDALDPAGPALAEAFAGAGYRTVAVVANRLINPQGGFARGFSHFDWATSERNFLPTGPGLRDLGELAEDLWPVLDAALAEEAAARERDPFFLYVHAFDPHDPYEEHPELDRALPVAAAPPVAPEGWQAEELRRHGREFEPVELDFLRDERGRYDQGVRHTDAELGRLFEGLERRGLLANAVVALVSDHGEGLWEHVTPVAEDELAALPPVEFFYQKHGASQYQEVLHTPLVLWGRGVGRGVRVAQAVENVDLFPTLLELAGVPLPPGTEGLHGRSLAALARGETAAEPAYVYSYGVHGNSVRETATELKLILPRGSARRAGLPLGLYDLARDPDERANLAGERPADVERLERAWAAWRERYPTEGNLGKGLERRQDREQMRILRSLGYTDLDVGGSE